jgi:HlyD family secretion protein
MKQRKEGRFSGQKVLGLIFLLLAACEKPQTTVFQGYAEGEWVYVSAPVSGYLEKLAVDKGQEVKTGELLFTLENRPEIYGVQEARKSVDQAVHKLNDLKKGVRASEMEALTARLKAAKLRMEFAEKEYRRREGLLRKKIFPEEEVDRSRTEYDVARRQMEEIQADMTTAGLGSRPDAVLAAETQVDTAKSRMEQASWSLEQKSQNSPVYGPIFDTYFQPGEWVPAGRPVVSILPAQNRKIRFFIPEPLLGKFRVGQELKAVWDGSAEVIPCRISYISPSAEYTPPVIFSSENRSKLVFLAEAVPKDPSAAGKLHPGQPVEVRWQ